MKAQIFLVVCALYLCAAVDFNSLDFAASAPLTFNHKIGGGAWNKGENGRYLDTVESLEGGDWACGDYVTHLIQVPTMPYTHDAPVSLTLTYSFTSDSTGQSGVGYGDFGKIQLNTGNVTNGGRTAPVYGPPFVYGLDTYINPNPGTASLTVIKKWLDKGMFISNGNLWITVRVDGLRPGDKTIVRMDVRIFCLPGTRPTGNLQGTLQSASQNYTQASNKQQVTESVNGGVQTVPLKNVGDILGIAPCTPSNITGLDFNATVYISDPNMGSGGTQASFYYSWKNGGFAIIGTSTNYTEIHTFDEQCSPNQAGELQYNQGACGCELTSIVTDQPRFFFTPDDTYYTIPGTPVVVNGVTYTKYTAKVSGPVLYLLYTTTDPTSIFRAYLTDGRVMTFSNVTYGTGTIPANAFTLATSAPTNCLCRRVIDINLVMDRNFYVSPTAFLQAQIFAANVAAQFTIGPSNVLIGTNYYDDAYYPVQSIANGNTLTNIQNAIKSIQCAKNSQGCGILNANVDVAAYIRRATADLLASPRAATAAKAILLVTTGWASTSSAVRDAVIAANASGVKVFAGVYNNIMLLSEITAALAPIEPRYVVNEFTSSSMTSAAGLPYLLQLSGVVCLASQTPCGTDCCGTCDTTCGKCNPVKECPLASNNCSEYTQLIGGCCVNTLKPGCAPGVNCSVGTCDIASGVCIYNSTCTPPAGTCLVGTCNPVNNTCKFTDPAKTEFCRKQVCIAGVLQWENISNVCPPDGCQIYTCNNATGSCDSVPLPNPYTLTPCETNQCVNGNWTAPVAKNCTSADVCKIGTCNPVTGVCEYSDKCPTNSANKCDLTRCNIVTGGCYQAVDTCAAQTTKCATYSCVNSTGACSVVNAYCGIYNNSCNNTQCDLADGLCKPIATPGCGPCDCTAYSNFKCIRGTCQGNQCRTSPIDCNAALPSTCHVASCSNSSGCVYTLRNCAAEITVTNCEEVVTDPNTTQCCSKRPKTCPVTDLCNSYQCNPANGTCTATYLCNPGNKCFFEICTSTGCQPSTANCPASADKCLTPKCDNATGCLLTRNTCDDGDGCTDDFCNSTDGTCSHTKKVCDDGIKCTDDTCVAGECVFNPKVCDDKISCTKDLPCDESTGTCPAALPDDAACVDVKNPCKKWTCDVSAGQCVVANVTCNTTGTDNCTGVTCIDFQGCTLVPKVCVLNYTKNPTDCTTISCQLATGLCVSVSQRCAAIDTATVIGATLSTAAVVGIIIAIIACVGLSGGSTYAIVNRMNDGALGATQNNPLFVARGADRVNPLYAHNG